MTYLPGPVDSAQELISQASLCQYELSQSKAYREIQPESGQLVLSAGEIHVWTILLDQPTEPNAFLAHLLSPDEIARAARLRDAEKRNRFAVGRGWLRLILSIYVKIAPEELVFRYGVKGKPYLESCARGSAGLPQPVFNFTHSEGIALLGVTHSGQLGIDLEWVHPISEIDTIARQYFSSREREVILSTPEEEKIASFFKLWTLKEAYIKARGDGFSIPFNSFTIDNVNPNREILIKTEHDGCGLDINPNTVWRSIPIREPRGFSAALVVSEQSL